jgi:hypothetical protein
MQQVALDFDGQVLQQHGANGSFQLVRIEIRTAFHDDLADFADNAYTTANYSANDFAPPDVTIVDNYTSAGQDTNGDGLYPIGRATARS